MQTSSAPGASQPTRRQRDARISARNQQAQSTARQRRLVLLATTVIVVVLVALAVARFVSSRSAPAAAPDTPAPADLVAQVANIDVGTDNQVGRGTVTNLPIPIRATGERGPNGLPLVTYVGAEYCPFCAGERWALVAALGRFGTFSGLQLSHSAAEDVYPNTATFSFVGSTYTSQYLELSSVELQSNMRSGSGYAALQSPTPAQTSALQTYDVPPYVPAQSAGSIPFIDVAGQYMVSGASYDVGVLRGMTAEQIGAALSDPSSPVTQGIVGSANALTATICSATDNTPAEVCGQPAVQSLAATLAAQPVPGRS
jgi:hypothetical protein